MKYRELYKKGLEILNIKKINNADNDAMLLLLETIGIDKTKYLLITDEEVLDNKIIDKYINYIDKRAKNYPLQYILGETYFYGLKFKVNENVLIPRFDTEVLVNQVIEDNKLFGNLLDLCTGSGCICITLAKYGKFKKVIASDISDEALKIAKENAIYNNVNIDFINSDLFDNINGKFDIVTINPPYIKKSDINNLDNEVKNFEPRIALDGGEDGLDFYRKISKKLKKYINTGGKVYVEIGYDQADNVKKIFLENGCHDIKLINDLAGNNRVLIINF